MAAVASSLIAVAGLAISATTTGISISQQNKARKKQTDAEDAADAAMLEARKRLDVNYQEASSINKDPYTMAIEASLQQGANATQAAKETQRGAAQVGRIQGAQNQMLEGQRVGYGQELQAREQRILNEDSRLRDINTQLDMGEIEGAQMAAAAEADNAAMAGQDIVAGVGNFAQQAASMAPLYAGRGYKAKQAAFNQTDFAKGTKWNGDGPRIEDSYTGVGAMNRKEFRNFQKNSPTLWGQVAASQQYQDALFPTTPALQFMLSQQQQPKGE
jgi:hypothetical protein